MAAAIPPPLMTLLEFQRKALVLVPTKIQPLEQTRKTQVKRGIKPGPGFRAPPTPKSQMDSNAASNPIRQSAAASQFRRSDLFGLDSKVLNHFSIETVFIFKELPGTCHVFDLQIDSRRVKSFSRCRII